MRDPAHEPAHQALPLSHNPTQGSYLEACYTCKTLMMRGGDLKGPQPPNTLHPAVDVGKGFTLSYIHRLAGAVPAPPSRMALQKRLSAVHADFAPKPAYDSSSVVVDQNSARGEHAVCINSVTNEVVSSPWLP